MCFAALIAISLSSYLNLALNSMRVADRSYYQNAAMNLVERGIEEALFSFNQIPVVSKTSPEDAWVPYGWTVEASPGRTATRTISGISVGPGVTAEIKLYCEDYKPANSKVRPKVVSKATLTFLNGPTLSKYVEVTIRKRAIFPRGMIVRNTIKSSGGSLTLDSWDSDPDLDSSTPMVAYSTTNRTAEATLATMNSANGSIDIGNASIYGYITTAGGTINYGSTAVLTGNFSSSEFDTDRVANDFEVTGFAGIEVPAPTVVNYISSGDIGGVSLPRTITVAGVSVITDLPNTDGVYYYQFSSGHGVNLSGTDILKIKGNVVLMLLNHNGTTGINSSGGSQIQIQGADASIGQTAGSLTVYTDGNVNLGGGGGLSNGNAEAASCVFWGTNPTISGQDFSLKGNGATSVSFFAPNANISMSGGGSDGNFFGAIVANSVVMNGNAAFHYDESLGRLYTGKPYGIAKWKELQLATERNEYAAKF
jgi:hypothetical protein